MFPLGKEGKSDIFRYGVSLELLKTNLALVRLTAWALDETLHRQHQHHLAAATGEQQREQLR